MPSKKYAIFKEFQYLDEIPDLLEEHIPSLQDCIPFPEEIVDDHIFPLLQYGRSIRATQLQIENTVELGTGYADLVVLLQEPSDREDTYTIKALVENDEYTYAGQYVNRSLQVAFRGQRDIYNTIVLDSRPLRPWKVRGNELSRTRDFRDREAYTTLMETLSRLRPKVILVCQCDWSGYNKKLGLPRELCSLVKKAGECWPWIMPNGHETKVVYGVHPGFAYKQKDAFYRTAIEYLIDASFVSAANALIGMRFFGDGFAQLRSIAQEAMARPAIQANMRYKRILHALEKRAALRLAQSPDLPRLVPPVSLSMQTTNPKPVRVSNTPETKKEDITSLLNKMKI